MLAPSIFNDNFVDSIFNDMFSFPFGSMNDRFHNFMNNKGYQSIQGMMSTDIQEFDNHYQLDFELPGFRKEDIKADITDGYLTICASRSSEENEKDEDGKYIRQERYIGECKRSFYIGDNIQPEDIKASFESGVLKMEIPKKQNTIEQNERKYISIADE